MTRTSSQNNEIARILTDLDEYFYEAKTECPYGLPQMAVYRQARFSLMPERLMMLLLDAGFRRNGDTMYCMRCPDCSACVPIRLEVDEFIPNRNQKRVAKKNQGVNYELGPLQMEQENIVLLDKFLAARYGGRASSAEDYYAGFFINSFGHSMEVRYQVDDTLLGVAIIDVGADWLNAVHFFFDTQLSSRSPGTFNVLTLIDICREQKIKNLYLGYWIKNVSSMSYKAFFKPHHLLQSGEWRKVTR